MHKNYVYLATQLLQSNNQVAFSEFSNALIEPSELTILFEQSKQSLDLTFVACQLLSKKIRDCEFVSFDQISEAQSKKKEEQKVIFLYKIVKTLSGTLSKQNVEQRIKTSCINLISLCIKCIFEVKKSSESFQRFFSILVPTYIKNLDFINSNNSYPVIITPKVMKTREDFNTFVQILSSLLDYVTMGAYSSNYYTFRRNLYVFKNTLLAHILEFTISNLKIHFHIYFHEKQLLNYQGLKECLELLDKILMFPYSLSASEPEFMDLISDDIAGTNFEIYFPHYFRNFLCDEKIVRQIFSFTIKQEKQNSNFSAIRDTIYSCIRIIGRSLSCTSFAFSTRKEAQNFRNLSLELMISLITEERHYDSWSIYCILMVQMKMFATYKIEDYQIKKEFYVEKLLYFLKNIMKNVQIKIEDGQKNPVAKVFDFLKKIKRENMGYSFEQFAITISQQILQIFFVKITNNNENQHIMREFGYNNSQQIQCFRELFMPIPEIFFMNSKKNLGIISNLNLNYLNQSSQTFWLYFSSLVLIEDKNISEEQIYLLIKFLKLAYNGRNLASVNFIHIALKKIGQKISKSGPECRLWREYEKKTQQCFELFLFDIMNYCLAILSVPDENLIENSLQIIKLIFLKLRESGKKPSRSFYKIIEERIKTINNTILVQSQFIKLRMGLYTIISLIWISHKSYTFIYGIYNAIIQPLRQNPTSFLHFLRYMIDLTGLLHPIDNHEAFKILAEMALNDLEYLLPSFLGTKENRDIGFNEPIFASTFVRLIIQFSDGAHNRIYQKVQQSVPLRVDELFRPYLIELLNYDYPLQIAQLWLKFVRLNPLSPLLPLHQQIEQKNNPFYNSIIQEYFMNLQKLKSLEDFMTLYPHIKNNITRMSEWWQEIIIRGLKPEINVRNIVEAKIWETNSQKAYFAKMLYRISKYDSNYWQIDGRYKQSHEYVQWFQANIL